LPLDRTDLVPLSHTDPNATIMKPRTLTYNPDNLSMVEKGHVPGYAGHKPGSSMVIGQRMPAAASHMVRRSDSTAVSPKHNDVS
jgi:hypothetical protein